MVEGNQDRSITVVTVHTAEEEENRRARQEIVSLPPPSEQAGLGPDNNHLHTDFCCCWNICNIMFVIHATIITTQYDRFSQVTSNLLWVVQLHKYYCGVANISIKTVSCHSSAKKHRKYSKR